MAIGVRNALAALALATPAVAAAQAPRQLKLKPADATASEEFTLLGSARELADGRVLVNDAREGRVVVLDLKAGTAAQVGRKGAGPGEYGMAAPLRPMGGDSSLMLDILARRWLIFDGAKIVTTIPPDAPIILATKGGAAGADGRGNVWFEVRPNSFDEKTTPAGTSEVGAKDSSLVVRASMATGKLDTVAKTRVAIQRVTVIRDGDGNFKGVSWASPPLAVGEQAALFPDGWFAIARLDPYRVDWIAPDGRVTRGRSLGLPVIQMSEREKDAYIERRNAANAANAGRGGNAGGRAGTPAALLRDAQDLRNQFPAVFPPFTPAGLIAAGDGHLLLLKPVSADFLLPRYDIVDRAGRLVGTLTLSKGERVLAVSKKSIYVSWTDDDDIQRLRRHSWLQFDPVKP